MTTQPMQPMTTPRAVSCPRHEARPEGLSMLFSFAYIRSPWWPAVAGRGVGLPVPCAGHARGLARV